MPYDTIETARHDTQGRSIPRLLRDFIGELTALMRDEVTLAKTEVRQNISELRGGLMVIGAGALVALAGFIILLNSAVVALLPYMPDGAAWLAPLIVGGVVLLIGIAILASGRSKLSASTLAPDQAIEHNREDRRMLKEQLS
jgi:hypothetical protein